MDFQILVVVVISIYGNTSSFSTCVLMDGNDNLHTGHFSHLKDFKKGVSVTVTCFLKCFVVVMKVKHIQRQHNHLT